MSCADVGIINKVDGASHHYFAVPPHGAVSIGDQLFLLQIFNVVD